jgi:hypothetical protein
MLTNLASMVGVDSFVTAETTAAVRSFNRFGKLAWDRTSWPITSRLTQVIPDVRVRSVQVGSGGSSYSSAPTIGFNGGGGNSAAATATINSDGEVNGIAVTNNGTAFTGVPSVALTSGGGSGATATASILSYIDFGTTISEIFRVTENDPLGSSTANEIAICSDDELSTLDETLAAVYKQARSSVSDAKRLKTEQVNWLKSLGTCNGNC